MSHKHINVPNYLPSEDFYSEVKKRIKETDKKSDILSISTFDLNRFNYVNDLFGYEFGDRILVSLTDFFSTCMKEGDFFSRIHADIFSFCIHFDKFEELAPRFTALTNWKCSLEDILPAHYSLTSCGGIVTVEDNTESVSSILDKANYARKKAKEHSTNLFLFYDETMSKEIQWQKNVTLSIESALKNHEFEMYLQPKVLIKNDSIVGAEALVRWNSPKLGLVMPDRFIPILEQNGFICQIDFFMLEEVCHFLSESKKNGIPQIPISVNFSKMHLSNEHLAERIFKTVTKWGISTELIEIEFTESLSIEGFDQLIQIISDLKLLGFKIALDDFGSAYSSLNCLKELPLDIIKIDKRFLETSSDTEKGKLILSKMVELIKSLRMLSVMEGVETNEQLEFLKKLSCDFAQGYLYAKPMPASDYISYVKAGNTNTDLGQYLAEHSEDANTSYLQVIPQEFQMDSWELYILGKNIDMGLMKGYLDGEATVQYVNDRALEYLGYNRQEFGEIFHNSIAAFTHPEDAHIVQKNIEQLIASGKSLRFQTRAIRKDGKVIVLQGRSSCVMDGYGRPIGLHTFQDVTNELERTAGLQSALQDKMAELNTKINSEEQAKKNLRIAQERCNAVLEQSGDIVFDWDFSSDYITFSEKYTLLFDGLPFIEKLSTNPAVRSKIHPDDLLTFENWVASTFKNPNPCETEYRRIDKYGNYMWISCRSSAICDDSGHPLRAVGLLSNISSEKAAVNELTLKSQRDPLTQLLNKGETQIQTNLMLKSFADEPGAFFMLDIDNFKGINDTLGHQLGDTILIEFARRVQEFFSEGSIVGRIGGDEIAVYLKGIQPEAVASRSELLLQALRITYYGAASQYNIFGSVGVSCYPLHGQTFDDLYHFADIALYESKRLGKDCFTIYQTNMTGNLKDNRTPVDWSDTFLRSYFQKDFTFKIFEMLYETKDMEATVQMILELLGTHFQVDRVYIFQNVADSNCVSNTHEWCAPDISSELEFLQNVCYDDLGAYLRSYTGEGVFCCPDIRQAVDEVQDICMPQGIKSLLHCAIYNEGNMAGFIGFDMCKDYHDWTGEEIAILGYISRILSVFLIKSNTALQLRTSYQNYVEMLENMNGYIYVVNPLTYEVLYVNGAVRALGMAGDQPCYQMAFSSDKPCHNCPINHLSEAVHYASAEIYSLALNGWVNSAASKLKWEGCNEAVLICCTDISKYKNAQMEKSNNCE